MNTCSDCNKSIVCCDFCQYAKYEDGIYCGPTGCSLYFDEKHQEIARHCGFCEDYHDRYIEVMEEE